MFAYEMEWDACVCVCLFVYVCTFVPSFAKIYMLEEEHGTSSKLKMVNSIIQILMFELIMQKVHFNRKRKSHSTVTQNCLKS